MQTQATLLSRLGPALRWLRDRQTRKQYQVADSAGITKGMLSAYETGRQRPSLETLEKILATLGCDLNDLHNALRVVNGDTEAAARSSWSSPSWAVGMGAGPAPSEGSAESAGLDSSSLYRILGIEHPLAPEEEAALTQMLLGFHRLLRFLHRSFRPGPSAATAASRAPETP